MDSRQREFQKWIDKEEKALHFTGYPEDAVEFKRPTDVDLYNFLDKFIDNYSWREDIFGDRMDINIFNYDYRQDKYEITEAGQRKYDIIRWLNQARYLSYVNNQNGTVTVHAVKESELDEFITTLCPEIAPATITFSASTKAVVFNGNKKQMQAGKIFKIFQYLAERPNERIPKTDIWRLTGRRDSYKGSKSDLSRNIGNVRTSLGATTDEIQLREFVTLHANVARTD